MATFIAVLCAIAMAICVPLVALKPQWVFYVFLTFVTFSSVFTGYINAAGNLGMPRTWAPADFLAWLTLAAVFFVPRERQFGTGVIGKCLMVLALMSALALIQGLLIHTQAAFTYSRVAHFVVAMIFGLRYFTNYSRVNGFLKFTVVLIAVMFVFHLLIRFAIYTPPVSEIDIVTQLGGERGVQSLVPLLYLALISIAVGRLVSKVGSSLISILALLIGASGVVLAETRSTYGAVGILAISSLIFVKGRVKNLILYSLAALTVVLAASTIGYDFLARFRREPGGKGPIVMPKVLEKGSWRTLEFSTIISSYKEEPTFILTGRGLGAMHPAGGGENPEVGYYHSEYLAWLDRCGLIGLVTILIMIPALLWRSFALARSELPYLRCYGVTCFLLMISLTADGFFHPIFSHPRAASTLICFAVIMANWRDIYQSLYQEPLSLQSDVYPELTHA